MIRIVIIGDEKKACGQLAGELSKHPTIEVVGCAVDQYTARDMIAGLSPDVVVLDLETSRLNGLSFLAKLMKHYPTPVVVFSALTPEKSEEALKALELGALEVVATPGAGDDEIASYRSLVRSVLGAARARLIDRPATVTTPVTPVAENAQFGTEQSVIAIGASTGGTTAIDTVLRRLPANTPGIVIAQHMPAFFTTAFAQGLNQHCRMEVREARDGDVVEPGLALLAPGDRHMILRQDGRKSVVRIKDGPPVHFQRPSVDVLFQSVARQTKLRAVGVLLTGMGSDGARGLLAMRESGAHTIAQDKESCLIFGMPGEAIKLGAAEEVLPLSEIAQGIVQALKKVYKAA